MYYDCTLPIILISFLKCSVIIFIRMITYNSEYQNASSTRPVSEKDFIIFEKLKQCFLDLQELEKILCEIENSEINTSNLMKQKELRNSIDRIKVEIEEQKLALVMNTLLPENIFWRYKVIDLECSIVAAKLSSIDGINNNYNELELQFRRCCQEKANIIKEILDSDKNSIISQAKNMDLCQYDFNYEDYKKSFLIWKDIYV